jgi:hypothetical protein
LICQLWSGDNPSLMITLLLHLFRLLPFLCGGHHQLALENLALRHQLAVYKRMVSRPRLRRTDRLFWVWLSRAWAGWRQPLLIVTPDTVLRWQRRRFGGFGADVSVRLFQGPKGPGRAALTKNRQGMSSSAPRLRLLCVSPPAPGARVMTDNGTLCLRPRETTSRNIPQPRRRLNARNHVSRRLFGPW